MCAYADALQEGPEPQPAAALDPPGGQPAEGHDGRVRPGRPPPLLLPRPAGTGRYRPGTPGRGSSDWGREGVGKSGPICVPAGFPVCVCVGYSLGFWRDCRVGVVTNALGRSSTGSGFNALLYEYHFAQLFTTV